MRLQRCGVCGFCGRVERLSTQAGILAAVDPPCSRGVPRFAYSVMDSDDEEAFATLMEEEAESDTNDEEHLMILAALAGLFANNAKPQ